MQQFTTASDVEMLQAELSSIQLNTAPSDALPSAAERQKKKSNCLVPPRRLYIEVVGFEANEEVGGCGGRGAKLLLNYNVVADEALSYC